MISSTCITKQTETYAPPQSRWGKNCDNLCLRLGLFEYISLALQKTFLH